MDCRDCTQQIGAWFDGELDAIASQQLERHLQACASCSSRVEALRSLRVAAKGPSLYIAAPTGLADQIRSTLRRDVLAPPAHRINSITRWSGIAAAILIAGFIGWQLPHPSAVQTSAPLAAQVLSAHLRSLMADHLLDVPSSDRHTVKPWFAGKINFSPEVRDCASDGFPLIGGRLEYLDNQPAAALVYRHDKHVINVFVWPSRTGEDSQATINGYHELRWQSDGLTYWAVSDASAESLQKLHACLTSRSGTTQP